jgi:hypothetical protein
LKAIGIAALIVGAALAPAAAISALPARAQGTASVEEAYALPDPTMTPGAIDPLATLDVICNRTTKERRHVSAATKADVLAAYNIPAADSASYEIDHLIPLALGGANATANLWPQPWAEADQKDALEVEMQRRACVAYRTLTPEDAAAALMQEQHEIAEDWPTAYARYVLRTMPPATHPVAAPTMTRRLKAAVGRLLRSWIIGSQRARSGHESRRSVHRASFSGTLARPADAPCSIDDPPGVD